MTAIGISWMPSPIFSRARGGSRTWTSIASASSLSRISKSLPRVRPNRRHTHDSLVNLQSLPEVVDGVRKVAGGLERVPVQVKEHTGELRANALPSVTIVKMGSYLQAKSPGEARDEVEILARIDANVSSAPLAGFVGEGQSPYRVLNPAMDAALREAVFSGMPVVIVGRGNSGGFTSPRFPFLGGGNLSATRARLLLMACLLRFGSLPRITNHHQPSGEEIAALRTALEGYQTVFDTH